VGIEGNEKIDILTKEVTSWRKRQERGREPVFVLQMNDSGNRVPQLAAHIVTGGHGGDVSEVQGTGRGIDRHVNQM